MWAPVFVLTQSFCFLQQPLFPLGTERWWRWRWAAARARHHGQPGRTPAAGSDAKSDPGWGERLGSGQDTTLWPALSATSGLSPGVKPGAGALTQWWMSVYMRTLIRLSVWPHDARICCLLLNNNIKWMFNVHINMKIICIYQASSASPYLFNKNHKGCCLPLYWLHRFLIVECNLVTYIYPCTQVLRDFYFICLSISIVYPFINPYFVRLTSI